MSANIGWRTHNGYERFGIFSKWLPTYRGGLGGHGHIYLFRGPSLRGR